MVRNGCNFDVSKCFKDGKALIIDGSHVSPDSFLVKNDQNEYRIKTDIEDTENKAVIDMQQKMKMIDQENGTLIIPFLLTIDAEQQV